MRCKKIMIWQNPKDALTCSRCYKGKISMDKGELLCMSCQIANLVSFNSFEKRWAGQLIKKEKFSTDSEDYKNDKQTKGKLREIHRKALAPNKNVVYSQEYSRVSKMMEESSVEASMIESKALEARWKSYSRDVNQEKNAHC